MFCRETFSSHKQMTRVLFCGVIDDKRGECAIDFAVMCLKVPFAKSYERFHIVYVDSHAEALTEFQNHSDADVLVCIPSSKANAEFVLNTIDQADKKCVVGLSVIPKVDWVKVSQLKPCTEFDIPRSHIGKIDSSGYAELLVRSMYDFSANIPKCFVVRKGFDANKDKMYVDTATVFRSTAKTEFAGVLKMRFATAPPAPA